MKVNVALGGGGAKGFVHIGVLEALVTRGYEVDSIVGTSMGAIIGSIFAYNATIAFKDDREPQRRAVEALTTLLLKEDFWSLFDVNWPSLLRRGIVKGTKIRAWLDDQLLGEGSRSVRFSALPMLTVTATDMLTGECLIMNRERSAATFVSDAVRASMSIQGIFVPEPLDYGGRRVMCWDGGATGNCRFDIARGMGGDLTVASSVTYRGEPRFLRTGRIQSGPATAPRRRPLRRHLAPAHRDHDRGAHRRGRDEKHHSRPAEPRRRRDHGLPDRRAPPPHADRQRACSDRREAGRLRGETWLTESLSRNCC